MTERLTLAPFILPGQPWGWGEEPAAVGTTWGVGRNADTQAPSNWETPLPPPRVSTLLSIRDSWGLQQMLTPGFTHRSWFNELSSLPHPQHGLGVSFINSPVVLTCSNAANFENHCSTPPVAPPSRPYFRVCVPFPGSKRKRERTACFLMDIYIYWIYISIYMLYIVHTYMYICMCIYIYTIYIYIW